MAEEQKNNKEEPKPEDKVEGKPIDKLIKQSIPEKITGKGGWRPGSGRPEGSLNKKTLEQKTVLDEIRQRVMKNVNKLFNAQFTLAMGCAYLFRIDDVDKNTKKRKHSIVSDPEEIKAFLDGEVDITKYYYITTKGPDAKAIDSLFDRTFGKSVQQIDLGDGITINTFGKLSDEQLEEQLKRLEANRKSADKSSEGRADKETGK